MFVEIIDYIYQNKVIQKIKKDEDMKGKEKITD